MEQPIKEIDVAQEPPTVAKKQKSMKSHHFIEQILFRTNSQEKYVSISHQNFYYLCYFFAPNIIIMRPFPKKVWK